jgi:hypothetical protein
LLGLATRCWHGRNEGSPAWRGEERVVGRSLGAHVKIYRMCHSEEVVYTFARQDEKYVRDVGRLIIIKCIFFFLCEQKHNDVLRSYTFLALAVLLLVPWAVVSF